MSIAELRKLPSTEKLKIIEALWSDLAGDEESFVSPPWHEDALRETASKFTEGSIQSFAWEEAKKKLRKQFDDE